MTTASFYWPMSVHAYGERAGWIETHRDAVSGRRRWIAFGPAGTCLGTFTSRDRAAYALGQNTLAMLYRESQFDPPEWPQ